LKSSRWQKKNSYRATLAGRLDSRHKCTGSYEFEKIRRSLLALGRFRDLASLNASGANLRALNSALRALHADGLQIWIKAAGGAIVRV
jgi:hypothetical protein